MLSIYFSIFDSSSVKLENLVKSNLDDISFNLSSYIFCHFDNSFFYIIYSVCGFPQISVSDVKQMEKVYREQMEA